MARRTKSTPALYRLAYEAFFETFNLVNICEQLGTVFYEKKKKTAFVFAGGGSLGAIQVGMLKAVTSAGIKADLLVGASVGAINAAFFASDPTPAGAIRLEKIWKGIKRQNVFQVSPLAGALSFLSWRNHICSEKPLKHLIEKHLSFERLEETKIPCHIVTTDLFNGIEVSFSKGPAVDALLASSTIPGVFAPVEIGEHYLIDGGVTPIKV